MSKGRQRLQAIWVLAARLVADVSWTSPGIPIGEIAVGPAKLIIALRLGGKPAVVLGNGFCGLHRTALSSSVATPS